MRGTKRTAVEKKTTPASGGSGGAATRAPAPAPAPQPTLSKPSPDPQAGKRAPSSVFPPPKVQARVRAPASAGSSQPLSQLLSQPLSCSPRSVGSSSVNSNFGAQKTAVRSSQPAAAEEVVGQQQSVSHWLRALDIKAPESSPNGETNIKINGETTMKIKELEKEMEAVAGMKSDLKVIVGDEVFNVHKFPLYSKTDFFPEVAVDDATTNKAEVRLASLPGGPDTFLLVATFCYGMDTAITPDNVATLRCAASYLDMVDDSRVGLSKKGNLASLAQKKLEGFLKDWRATISILRSCEGEGLLAFADNLNITSAAINALAHQTVAMQTARMEPAIHLQPELRELGLGVFARCIQSFKLGKLPDKEVHRAISAYAQKWLPAPDDLNPAEDDVNWSKWRTIVETLVELQPTARGSADMSSLLRLLRCAVVLNASKEAKYKLLKRAGDILDQASLEDLLGVDVQDVQGLLAGFMSDEHQAELVDREAALKSTASLIDRYLQHAAASPSPSPSASPLSTAVFQSLVQLLPERARPVHDELYWAVTAFVSAEADAGRPESAELFSLIQPARLSEDIAETAAADETHLPLDFRVSVLQGQKEILKKKREVLQEANGRIAAARDEALAAGGAVKHKIATVKERLSSLAITTSTLEGVLREENQNLRDEVAKETVKRRELEKRLLSLQQQTKEPQRKSVSRKASIR